MKKGLLIVPVLVFVLFLIVSIVWWEPLSELSPEGNYTILKRKDSWELFGGGQSRKYLLQIDNPDQFKKDCDAFFSVGNGNSDAYFYCDLFFEDASVFSAGYDGIRFSFKSLKMWKNERDLQVLWRCIFSENKKYCYIEWISLKN